MSEHCSQKKVERQHYGIATVAIYEFDLPVIRG